MCGLIVVAVLKAASHETLNKFCEADDGKNCQTKGTSLLQRHTERQKTTLQELAETENEKYENDARQGGQFRIEKHDAFELRIFGDSPTLNDGRKNWIFISKDDGDQSVVDALSECKPEGATISSKGHPDQGGTSYVVMEATDDEVKQELTNCKDSVDADSIVVETDSVVHIPDGEDQEQDPALLEASSSIPWGLDRIDQRDLPMDQSYSSPAGDGDGVDVYVADTGIFISHDDFGGRAVAAWTAFPQGACQSSDSDCANDGHGHGTHCAGTIAGNQYGVAKKATVHAVKVLSDSGSGSTLGVIAGMDWVETQHENDTKPVVLSMSLGSSGNSQAMEAAVNRALASGVMVVVAAGNSNRDACGFSPAFVPGAITVGSTTNTDARSSFSNYGSCLDMYAPGSAIESAWKCNAGTRSCSASRTISGTSMACPHVSGALALLIAQNPSEDSDFIEELLKSKLTPDKISDAKYGSPNMLLHVNNDTLAPTAAPTPAPTPSPACADKSTKCADLKAKGKCTKFGVQKKCQKTCNKCCMDLKKNNKCETLKSKCSRNNVKKSCPLTCEVCSVGDSS